MKKIEKEFLSEKVKTETPSSLELKLHSYYNNRMQWLYYSVLIYQEQNELRLLDLKAWQGCYSLHNLASSDMHKKALSEYQNEQFKYFRSMCCDALDICNELFDKSYH